MTVQYPGTKGVLPGYGHQNPNDWGLGFEIRDGKSPHWTGSASSPRTFGHFGQSGTFLWIDPDAALACVSLTDRAFGPWAVEAWPPSRTRCSRRYGPDLPAMSYHLGLYRFTDGEPAEPDTDVVRAVLSPVRAGQRRTKTAPRSTGSVPLTAARPRSASSRNASA